MSSQIQTPQTNSSPTLIRTTHNEDGVSVFVPDTHVAPFEPFGPKGSGFNIFDVRQSVPVTNTDAISSFGNSLPRCPPKGSLFCMTQISPGGKAPMHRTKSLDYAVVLSGEIVLALDGGEEKTVKQGQIMVQQGVNHSWENRGEVTCQIIFVMIGAETITLQDGTALEETVFK
ncbi:cupin 2 domain-containing protein [Fusarium heterosporum]|uniref:Cupin 2 domain-containing protein n=1 Tax=Fusarium heterosporum TaxID=42747 RepID=A0A8H5U0R0_FUSHE|nr:cupin 2 domain-containing protein [Fusarium heterosporum]